MKTAVATMDKQFPSESPVETGNIVQNRCRRAELFKKIQDIQIYDAETNKQGYFGTLNDRTNCLFIQLCRSKFGLSIEQLNKLNKEELGELAAIVHERSKKWCFVQASGLGLIPVIGWFCLAYSLLSPYNMSTYNNGYDSFVRNMRYYVWYNEIRKLSGKNFSPGQQQ